MITVKTKKILENLPTSTDGEYAVVEEESCLYQFKEGIWEKAVLPNGQFSLSLNELNSSIFAQLKPFTAQQLKDAASLLFQYLGDTMDKGPYWAMICWEKRYVTIFRHDEDANESLCDILIEMLQDLGEIKDISINKETGGVEIWITDEENTNCYILFNYTLGVVEGVA